MRIAVLTYPMGNPERLISISKAFVDGLQSQGHFVDMLNIRNESNARLGTYDYICIGAQGGALFSSKLDQALAKRLEGLLGCSGKRCFAFVDKKPFFSEALLKALMKAMESQGMFLRNSAVISSVDEARQIGATLEITKKA